MTYINGLELKGLTGLIKWIWLVLIYIILYTCIDIT
jgi:hypothetical protein